MGWSEEGCARVRRLRELRADGALLQALLVASALNGSYPKCLT